MVKWRSIILKFPDDAVEHFLWITITEKIHKENAEL